MDANARNSCTRYSPRTLLLLVAGVAVICGSWFGYRKWYIAAHPVEVMFEKLRSTRRGDSLVDFERRLGSGYRMQPSEARKWMPSELREWMLHNTAEGYQEGDEFVRYDMGNLILYFQFRNGHLINHNPADFSEAPVLHGTWR